MGNNAQFHPNRNTSFAGPCPEIRCWWGLHCFLSTSRSAVSKSLCFLTFYSFQGSLGSPNLPRTFLQIFPKTMFIFLPLPRHRCVHVLLSEAFICFAGRAGLKSELTNYTHLGKSYLPLVVCFTGEILAFFNDWENNKVKRVMHFRTCENYVKFKFQC